MNSDYSDHIQYFLEISISFSSGKLIVVSETLAWGVESKFSEPFYHHTRRKPFAKSYFQDDVGLWVRLDLPRCQELAEQLDRGQKQFRYLDASQLLKHALGIRQAYKEGKLILLWYDVGAPEARLYEDEIRVFANSVDKALGFSAITHQQAFARLATEPNASAAYINYLRSRYFEV
jgi:hypothetical protein